VPDDPSPVYRPPPMLVPTGYLQTLRRRGLPARVTLQQHWRDPETGEEVWMDVPNVDEEETKPC
jgi:hypothetical protein